ncbi:MAG: STAS/SEC14 domain-containing protein [Candidatus Promineifilaceae bacterium]|nr:STAS/SEC14 domain-containing protein [Candidatus Promineifilaceae bacterium]
MIEKIEQSTGSVLGYRLSGTIGQDDYDAMMPEVESLIEKEGYIQMLFDMTGFKWEKVSAWGEDMKFGRKFHKNITKMAIVGDKKWQKWMTKIADPFYAVDARFFPVEESENAWSWLGEDEGS